MKSYDELKAEMEAI
jgi:hypothetical protein